MVVCCIIMQFPVFVNMQVGGGPLHDVGTMIGIVNFWKDSMAFSVEQCKYVMWTEVGYGLCNCPLRTSVFHPSLLTPLWPLLLSHRFSLSLPSTSLTLFPHPLNILYVMVTVYRHTVW